MREAWNHDLNEKVIRQLLGDLPWGTPLFIEEEVGSTNGEMLRLAGEGLEEGAVMLADRQTAGRGRERRNWFNPSGGNIAMSWLLRPRFSVAEVPSVVLPISLGICHALRDASGLALEIKWPNDILYRDAKICGVLCESRLLGGGLDALVVGVGINVNNGDFPEELAESANSLYLSSGRRYRRDEMAAMVLRRCWAYYQDYFYRGNREAVWQAYLAASGTLGRRVCIRDGERHTFGDVVDIDQSGALCLRGDDGGLQTFYAGEVSLRSAP